MRFDLRKRGLETEGVLSRNMAPYHGEKTQIRLSNIYRGCKKYLIFHLLVVFLVIYFLYAFGGLIPRLLLPRLPFLQINSDINALMFFDVNNDASKVTWARATNSREALEQAIQSKVHMIEGDIILQGQGTDHQKLVPVMAKLPHSQSDLPFVDWLDKVKDLDRGIKLDINTVDALDIALQRLSELNAKHPIRFPVWIHANILPGPHGGEVKVDPSRFFHTIKRLFPKCTVSLGWTTGTHTDLRQSGYSWTMVMDMYDLVKKWRIHDQPVVFEARLSLIRNSVPQLKWLCDVVAHSALNIVHVEGDAVIGEDLMYVAYRFPPEGVFFDLNHRRFENMLTQYRHFSKDKVSPLVTKRDEVIFKPRAWVKMGFYIQKDSILPSTEALVLMNPIVYVVTKSKYRPTNQIYIQGRVQFLNRNNAEAEPFETGLNIYLRPKAYANFDHISGIKCFLGVNGDVEVKGSLLPEKVPEFRKTARITPSAIHCFRFRITDTGDQVIFQVKTEHDCHTLESVVPDDASQLTLTVDIPGKISRDQDPFILRTEDNNRQAVIDELSVKHEQ